MSATPVSNSLRKRGGVLLRLFAALALPAVSSTAARSSSVSLPAPFFHPVVVLSASSTPLTGPLRVLTWNIDRGTHLPQILSTLQRLPADILLLQEVDRGTLRTSNRDVAHELAQPLGLSEAFGIEFEELSQESGTPAYTGQATLTRLPVRNARMLRFQNQSGFWQPQSWLPSSLPLLQRRLGSRIALVTELDYRGKLLVVYNLHLESRSYGRIQFQQLDEVLADCRSRYPAHTAVILGGDLNSKYLPSRYLHKLKEEGFLSATGEQIERTHTIAMALDWLFVRDLPKWQTGTVEHSAQGSDHYPIRAQLASEP